MFKVNTSKGLVYGYGKQAIFHCRIASALSFIAASLLLYLLVQGLGG